MRDELKSTTVRHALALAVLLGLIAPALRERRDRSSPGVSDRALIHRAGDDERTPTRPSAHTSNQTATLAKEEQHDH
ncbi:MAG: hypothetical protein ACXVUE_24030 [Solirubrobacteraceae bacterium]